MNPKQSEQIISYTIWHWESFYAIYFDQDKVIPLLVKSFDALV